MSESTSSQVREVTRVVRAVAGADGAGVRLQRSIGGPSLDHLDPFLLLDEIKSEEGADYIGGFPDHPHRGFETVTYMLQGNMQHKDHMGHQGDLCPGSAQWMTAGRGIIHSEMPQQADGMLWGFQLWVNLPSQDKMRAPRYQDIPPEDIPEVPLPGGGKVRVVAGQVGNVVGAVTGVSVDPTFLHVELAAGQRWEQPLPAAHNSFVYVFKGAVALGTEETPVMAGHLAVLSAGGSVRAKTDAESAGLLLIAGRPLKEPVARYGPFVMNTREELVQAFRDFESGRLLA